MVDKIENTITAYLGYEFQKKLVWQLLVEPDFAEKVIPNLLVEYFDDITFKRLFIIIGNYYNEFARVPNLQNKSIYLAIKQYANHSNEIEVETLMKAIESISLWNEKTINKEISHDGDVVQKAINIFIKQQEYRKLAENILVRVKSGEIKNKKNIAEIEESFQKISRIGEDVDDCDEVIEGIDSALRKEFRKTIATGVNFIDVVTGGGLGKGEIGLILTPSGVGKTTLLTKIANTAYLHEKNVAQIVFEDTKDQIKRKHFSIWSGIGLSDFDSNIDTVRERVVEKIKILQGRGRIVIKKFSQEDTTMRDIKNWLISYQKKYGFKFDLVVLDYLDCLEPNRRSADRNEAELSIVKSFEAFASEFDIPAWSAIQANRSAFRAEYLDHSHTGGSIKRVQKAHFFMSVAKTQEQKESHFANVMILKARFASDGQTFKDCIFNNNTMEIRVDDDRYKLNYISNQIKKDEIPDIDGLDRRLSELTLEKSILRANDSSITNSIMIDLVSRSGVMNNIVNDNVEPNNSKIIETIEEVEETPIEVFEETYVENIVDDFSDPDEEGVSIHEILSKRNSIK